MKLGSFSKFIGGLLSLETDKKVTHVHHEVSFIHTHPHGEKTVRIVKGQIINDFVIDYSKTLKEIKVELEQLLVFWLMTYAEKVIEQIGRFPKPDEIEVYEGSNHIDVILKGKGSLGWLTVEDHRATKLKYDFVNN